MVGRSVVGVSSWLAWRILCAYARIPEHISPAAASGRELRQSKALVLLGPPAAATGAAAAAPLSCGLSWGHHDP